MSCRASGNRPISVEGVGIGTKRDRPVEDKQVYQVNELEELVGSSITSRRYGRQSEGTKEPHASDAGGKRPCLRLVLGRLLARSRHKQGS